LCNLVRQVIHNRAVERAAKEGLTIAKKAPNLASQFAKKIPGVGMLAALASAYNSGDASAALGEMTGSEDVGPEAGSIGAQIEDPQLQKQMSEEDMKKAALQQFKCGGVSKKNYEKGGVQDGSSYVGDRVDAKINSGEMVLNVAQQQKLMDLLRDKADEIPNKDIVEPAAPEETNLHEKNKELSGRVAMLENLVAKLGGKC
jgi:hypothetical protein